MEYEIIADVSVFNYTYDILTSKLNEWILNRNNKDMALIFPAAVNGALSCELYMRAMIQTPPHKQDELFELLDVDTQSFVLRIMVDIGKSKDTAYDETKFKAVLKGTVEAKRNGIDMSNVKIEPSI